MTPDPQAIDFTNFEGIEEILPYQAFRAHARACTSDKDQSLRSLRKARDGGLGRARAANVAMGAGPVRPIRMRWRQAQNPSSVRPGNG